MGFSKQEYWSGVHTLNNSLDIYTAVAKLPLSVCLSLLTRGAGFLPRSLWVLITQCCLTFYDAVDYSPPGSSVHGIIQARTLERVAIFLSRGSSLFRDQPQVSCGCWVGRWILDHWATWPHISKSHRIAIHPILSFTTKVIFNFSVLPSIQFINKYLWSVYCRLGVFLGSWDISASKMEKDPCHPKIYIQVLRDWTINNNDNDNYDDKWVT